MTRHDLCTLLGDVNACTEAQEWVDSLTCETAEEVWNLCERGDWLLWIAGKLPGVTRQRLVFAACQCARLALPFVDKNDLRPLKCIETTEAWTRDEATIEELESARGAAYAAAAAAAAYAAYAYAADAAADAAADGLKRVLRECADIVRKHITFEEVAGR